MFRLFICFFLLVNGSGVYAQIEVDTVYVKYASEEILTTRDYATHLRIQKIFADTLYAEDYRIKDNTIAKTCYYRSFDPVVREGLCVYYSDSGRITAKGMYVANKQTGEWNTYYPNGRIWYTVLYVDDERDGPLTSYYSTGEVKRRCTYQDGKLTSGRCFTRSGRDTSYYELYVYPEFKGGDDALIKYFQKNLKYPKEAMKYKLEGKVYVQFTVKKDGSIEDVNVDPERNSYYLLNDAAVDFVKQMPKWSPGYVDGELKDFKKTIPILFKLK